MENQTLIQAIVSVYQAYTNCVKTDNQEWRARHLKSLKSLYDLLPSGSGIDTGTNVIEVSEDRLVLGCSFHHMNENGFYTAWTEHTVKVYPDWTGIRLAISGRDLNDIKDHLHEVYYHALTSRVQYDSANERYTFAPEAM